MDQDDQDRNRRLAANIAAGKSPLTDELIETMRATAAANLDVPGPRVLQLLDELERLRAIEQRATTYTCVHCGQSAPWTDGQSREAGDPVDEFWCQTCGHEQPLPRPDARAVR